MKYKGCFRSNFDNVEVLRYTAHSYYRSKLDFKSYLDNNKITNFMHRVFYFMHEVAHNRKVEERKESSLKEYDYTETTKAMLDDLDFDVRKWELDNSFNKRLKNMHNGHANQYAWQNDEPKDPCKCKMCDNPKALKVMQYFRNLAKNEDITYNGYNTKNQMQKFIISKKMARFYFSKILDQGIFHKHGIMSKVSATRSWRNLFPNTRAMFKVMPLYCPILKERNSRSILGFGLQKEPSKEEGYYGNHVLEISPTYFYKVYMKGFGHNKVEINSKRVFIADVKLLKADKEISTDPRMKLYKAVGYVSLNEKVTKHFYTILTYQYEDGHGTIEMNTSIGGTQNRLGDFVPPKVHISGIEKDHQDLTSAEKRRLVKMMESRVSKGNLKAINAI